MPIEGVSWIGAAGFDYRELVRKIIQAESRPIAMMQQRMARFDLQKAAWTDIKTRLENLRAALAELNLDATFQGRVATSSNPGVVTATADTTAALGTYNIAVTSLAQAHVVRSDLQDSAWTLSATDANGDGKLSFTVNGVEVVVANGDTLATVRDKINQANAGVTASVVADAGGQYLVLKANSTGTANAIKVNAGDDPDNILTALGVVTKDASGNVTGFENQLQAAADAQFSVDGLTLTRGSNTVSDVIGGVTLTLVAPGSNVTLTVGRDVQKAVDKVKAFVDQYNSLLDLVHQKVGTVTVNGEEKRGDLYQDPTLGRLEQTLRRDLSAVVEGLTVYTRLADIGITTSGTANGGSLEAAMEGKLTVDEARLRAALEADSGAVKELFFASDAAINGIGELLEQDLNRYLQAGGIVAGQIDLLGDRRADLEREIERLNALLAKREQTLLARFIAAEKVLTLLQQQGTFLSSQLSVWQSQR